MPANAERRRLRVRMYRTGFGECILISLPDAQGQEKHILVDCGVHPKGDIGTMARVFKDVAAASGGALAAVVVTHEHADHVSGFGTFDAEFARLQIGEIWMPWAMDPDDALAVELRQKRLTLAKHLAAHLAATPGSAAALEAVSLLRGNERALEALRSRFRGAARQIRYLKAGERIGSEGDRAGAAGIDGLSIDVLAPPTDAAALQQMDPPASQRLLRDKAGDGRTGDRIRPFGDRTALPPDKGRARYGLSQKDGGRLEQEVAAAARSSLDSLAFALDSAANNTSLVLLLTFRGQTLLLTGDAQWGSWKSWVDLPRSRALLGQLTFLKVSHHGSQNATPKCAVEALASANLAAMVSTQTKPWASIPRESLLERLAEKTKGRVLRTDSLAVAGAPSGPSLPARLPDGFSAGEIWLDYSVPV